MKKSPKNEPALSDMLLKLRFAEKNHVFWFSFPHEVPILGGCQAVGLLCTVGFQGENPLGLPSPTAC